MAILTDSFVDHCKNSGIHCQCGATLTCVARKTSDHYLRHVPSCPVRQTHQRWTSECARIWREIRHIPAPTDYHTQGGYLEAVRLYREEPAYFRENYVAIRREINDRNPGTGEWGSAGFNG